MTTETRDEKILRLFREGNSINHIVYLFHYEIQIDDVTEAIRQRLKTVEQDNADYDASFELRHAADMRAIERWRAATPGKMRVLPDHADLCVWLLEERDNYLKQLTSDV